MTKEKTYEEKQDEKIRKIESGKKVERKKTKTEILVQIPNYARLPELIRLLSITPEQFARVMDGRSWIVTADVQAGKKIIMKAGTCVSPEEYVRARAICSVTGLCMLGCNGIYEAAKFVAKKEKNEDLLLELFIPVTDTGIENEEVRYRFRILKSYVKLTERSEKSSEKAIAVNTCELSDLINGKSIAECLADMDVTL